MVFRKICHTVNLFATYVVRVKYSIVHSESLNLNQLLNILSIPTALGSIYSVPEIILNY